MHGQPQPSVNGRKTGVMNAAQRNSIKLNALHATLEEVGARGCGVFNGPSGSDLKFYSVDGNILIIQVFADDDGYEVYTPIERSNSITTTITTIRSLVRPASACAQAAVDESNNTAKVSAKDAIR